MIMGIVLAFVVGALGWTFAEYALHNWAGHVPRGKIRFSKDHLKHHADNRYFAPTSHKIYLAVVVGGSMFVVSSLVVGAVIGSAFSVGFISMYATYEIMHRRAHTHAPLTRYGRWQRKHHFHHHFGAPKHNHGVTTPVFDMLFGTLRRPEIVKVPERHAMDWLVDPSTGEIFERYQADYVLVGRGRRGNRAADRKAAFDNRAPEV